MKRIFLILSTIFFLGCEESENTVDIQEPVSFELEENIIGKWDVSNNPTNPFEREDDIIHSIIFNSDKSFKINYSDGTIEGNYKVDSETELTLENIGKMTNTSVSNQSMTSNLSLNNIVEKSLESNGDTDFQEGDCTTFLDCMDGKVFITDNGIKFIKIEGGDQNIERSFKFYYFDSKNSCCHFEDFQSSYYHLKDEGENDNVDIFENTKDYISYYIDNSNSNDKILRYRKDEFGNFIQEVLEEGNNQYDLEISYNEESNQTVLDNMLQEYGGNVVCETIDESNTFFEKQNGKYYKYSYGDYNWYFKFTNNPDEYFTIYQNLNDTTCYNFFNKINNNLGFEFYDTSQYPFQIIDFNNGFEFLGCPDMNNSFCLTTVITLFMNNCGQLYVDNFSEPYLHDTNGPMKYITGFEYWNNNNLTPDYQPWIIFDEISQSDFESEVLNNICE